MLHRYANDEWREKYLQPLVAGELFPSFGMTEPGRREFGPHSIENPRRA